MLKDYVFLSGNAAEDAPETGIDDSELEKFQILGFSSGENPGDAFKRLATANGLILKKALSNIFSYELIGDSWTNRNIVKLG